MGSRSNMTLEAQYDDLCRYTAVLTSGPETEFRTFVDSQLNCVRKWKGTESDVRILKENISSLQSENRRLETKIMHLKDLLRDSLSMRKKIESEKKSLARQIAIIKEVLLADSAMDNHTKEKLAFLSSTCKLDINSPPKLQTIEESAGSLFSLSDIDQTDDDLESARRSSNRRGHRSRGKRSSSESRASLKKKKLDDAEQPLNKENKLEDMALKPLGRCNSEPTSISPEIPTNFHQDHTKGTPVQKKYNTYNLRNTHSLSACTPTGIKVSRNHEFVSKTVIKRLQCYPCGLNIGYLKQALRCQNCAIICHPGCKGKFLVPCFPLVSTPTKGSSGTIAEYTSSSSPMIPPLIVHCIDEIESRGLNEVGLYRINGSKREVKSLKEKFLNGRTLPCLNGIDIHTICETIKDFLRNLKERLISCNERQAFVDAAEIKDETLSSNALYALILDLPQPNRDTLSFLILHLQKVAESPNCRMNIESLARIFGPTIIDYSVQNPADMRLETTQQCQVMQRLLSIPSDSCQNLLNVEANVFQSTMKKTPENLPAPKETRLGPIYTQIHKNKNANTGKSQFTPRKYNKSGRMHFSSPLLK